MGGKACRACGNLISDKSAYANCLKCGTPINEAQVTPPIASAPAGASTDKPPPPRSLISRLLMVVGALVAAVVFALRAAIVHIASASPPALLGIVLIGTVIGAAAYSWGRATGTNRTVEVERVVAPTATSTLAPTPAPTVAPTPAPTVAPTPAPVPYQVQQRDDVSFAGRKRTSVAVFIPGQPTKEQVIATLAAIARAELGSADVVSILAWRSLADRTTCVAFTVGGAELSTDSRGWAAGQERGGMTTLYGADNGQIQGSVVPLVPLDRAGCTNLNKPEGFSVPR